MKRYAVLWAETENLGDDIQALAAIHLLKKNNIHHYHFIEREKLSDYAGETVHLIMAGWFMHDITQFSFSKNIIPLFIAFHCSKPELIEKNKSLFKQYEPIGCRDLYTLSLFQKYNIMAYFSGCLTLGFDTVSKKSNETYLVDVNTVDYIPKSQIKNLSMYSHAKKLTHLIPLSKRLDIAIRLKMAEDLLSHYKTAALVITSRLHCALPCRAFGTKVKFIHEEYTTDHRFKGLEPLLSGEPKGILSVVCNRFKPLKKIFSRPIDLNDLPSTIDQKRVTQARKNINKYFSDLLKREFK